MLDWLIVGGGIHGTHLSNVLVNAMGVDPDALRVVDPHREPLAIWRRLTANCGMHYLRSPAAHNIDLQVTSTYKFARSAAGEAHADFIDPYYRPALNLFNRHCDWVIATRKLARLRIVARAAKLIKAPHQIGVLLDSGETIATRRVLIAIGMNEQPLWPAWARRARLEGGRICHLFSPRYPSVSEGAPSGETVIVGGGISGLQTALHLAATPHARVSLLLMRPLRLSPYDFDPCWIGPKCMREFSRIKMGRRREIITAARRPGTAPQDVVDRIVAAKDQGLKIQQAMVRTAAEKNGRIHLTTSAGTVEGDRVILATGYDERRPGGTLVDDAIESFGLRTAACGYPLVAEDLRWEKRIFVAGPLSELVLGPCARNIVGARNAGRRLLESIG